MEHVSQNSHLLARKFEIVRLFSGISIEISDNKKGVNVYLITILAYSSFQGYYSICDGLR